MPIVLPTNPTVGQTYQSGSSATYQWNGTYWETVTPPTQVFVTATSASFASTGSSVNTLNQSVVVSGSFTVFTGSAVEFQVHDVGVKLGSLQTDRHQITGSLNVTGSITGSLFGTASFAVTASYYRTLYANLGLTADVTGITSGSDISWTTAATSSGITVSGANITLPAGTWMVNSDFNGFNYTVPGQGYLNINLVTNLNAAIPGTSQANPGPVTASYNYSVTGNVIGIFTLPTTSVVKFRTVLSNGSATLAAANTRAIFTSMNI